MEFDNAVEDTSVVESLLLLAAASQQPCISELISFTRDLLYKELELLRIVVEWIRRQIQEVVVGNYRAFIVVADALLAIREEVSSIDKHLESLIDKIPKLTSRCTEFISRIDFGKEEDEQNIAHKSQYFV